MIEDLRQRCLDRRHVRTQERSGTQVLLDGQIREHAPAFRHVRDAAADDLFRCQPVDPRVVEADLSAGERFEPGNGPQGRSLARAVRADDGDDATGRYRHRDALEGCGLLVANLDIAEFKQHRPLRRKWPSRDRPR